MSIELALILIGVLLLMAWTWRYRDDENRKLRAQVMKLYLQLADEKQRNDWLKSELGATQDAAAQDVELWR